VSEASSRVATTEAPPRVVNTMAFFGRHSVWNVSSRNSPATSCRDAAARRTRLGSVGIPLFDELKSLCVAAYMPSGERHYALLHCRAHLRFDMEAARALLGATRPLARLGNDELEERFSTRYGTVNPFSEANAFIQVFDESVLDQYTAPHSMMTNAGDLRWAVEFRPTEIIEALRAESPTVMVGRITENEVAGTHHLPSFGIVTGNGPDSGIALWQQINKRIHDQLTADNRMRGDLSYPRVFIQSLPEMGLSMELVERKGEVWAVVRDAVERLIQQGADYIAIACNTTQYFADRITELCRPQGVEFVGLADLTAEHIARHHLEDLTIVGIPVVADLGEHSGFRALGALGVQPVDPKVLPDIQEIGYMVKRSAHQAQDNKALNKLQHVLRSGVRTNAVIIALTEISILLARFSRLQDRIGGKVVVDTLKIYGDALADRYLSALPKERIDEGDVWE